MKKKEKYYVVWSGVTPGIYRSWADCQLQVKGYAGARYKAFDTQAEAEAALASSPADYIRPAATRQVVKLPARPAHAVLPPGFTGQALAVDAACSGNPGQMEYRGIHLPSFQEVFHFGPVYGTNNIGEFLAIVHGLALLKQKGWDWPLYSDSANALNWVKQKTCKTRLPRDARTEQLFQIIGRAERWLRDNTYTTPLCKWQTEAWGEIPADFGRK